MRDAEAEFVGVRVEEALEDRGFTSAAWAGDDDGSVCVEGGGGGGGGVERGHGEGWGGGGGEEAEGCGPGGLGGVYRKRVVGGMSQW